MTVLLPMKTMRDLAESTRIDPPAALRRFPSTYRANEVKSRIPPGAPHCCRLATRRHAERKGVVDIPRAEPAGSKERQSKGRRAEF